MLLIVGLGNPGREYENNRHNVGWLALDAIHRRHGFGPWRRRFAGETADGLLGGHKALLLKPLTFMNDSGRSVGEAARFLKIDLKDIVVVHDELDLPAGKVRIKAGGGGAGHNGLKSITAHLGNDYRRLRIGIGHPGQRDLVSGYVLHDFPKADAEWLDPLLDAIAAEAPLLADGKDAEFANRLHRGPGPAEKPSTGKTVAPKAESVSQPDKAAPPSPDKETAGPFAGLRKLFGAKD